MRSAMERYAVSLPPATETTPAGPTHVSSRRDSSDGEASPVPSWGAISGRTPAHMLSTSSAPRRGPSKVRSMASKR